MKMEEITEKLVNSVVETMGQSGYVQVEISARHVHLSQNDLEALFGSGAQLIPKRALSQPGQFLAEQRVTLIGRKGQKENVAVLGPVRNATQVELSKSDAVSMGVEAPFRESGDIKGSGSITIEGTKGAIGICQGVIIAHNHIHITPDEAGVLGLADKQRVSVEIEGERPVVFKDVIVRVNKNFRLRMHIDFDEANAADIGKLTFGKIVSAPFGRPVLLLLPQEKNPAGMRAPEEAQLDKELLAEKFDLLCARTIDYNPDWSHIDGVIAFGLTVESLGKIASGIMDDCYTKAMCQAILRGKPVYILRSQIELFQYEKSAPDAYLKKLQEHLTLLEESGLTAGEDGGLEAIIMHGNPEKVSKARPSPSLPEHMDSGNQWGLTKHLVIESDLAEASRAGVKQITIAARAILTDLARDFAQGHNITIIRE